MLDDLVSECGNSKPALRYQDWANDIINEPDIAGSFNYEHERGIVDVDNAFEMAMNCPDDKMVWAGYSKPDDIIFFVYATDEKNAVDILKHCFNKVIKNAKGKRT